MTHNCPLSNATKYKRGGGRERASTQLEPALTLLPLVGLQGGQMFFNAVKEGDTVIFASDDEQDRILWVQAMYRATGQSYKPVPASQAQKMNSKGSNIHAELSQSTLIFFPSPKGSLLSKLIDLHFFPSQFVALTAMEHLTFSWCLPLFSFKKGQLIFLKVQMHIAKETCLLTKHDFERFDKPREIIPSKATLLLKSVSLAICIWISALQL